MTTYSVENIWIKYMKVFSKDESMRTYINEFRVLYQMGGGGYLFTDNYSIPVFALNTMER